MEEGDPGLLTRPGLVSAPLDLFFPYSPLGPGKLGMGFTPVVQYLRPVRDQRSAAGWRVTPPVVLGSGGYHGVVNPFSSPAGHVKFGYTDAHGGGLACGLTKYENLYHKYVILGMQLTVFILPSTTPVVNQPALFGLGFLTDLNPGTLETIMGHARGS